MTKQAKANRQQAAWGFVLVAAGILFLLIQSGAIERGSIRHWWPGILVAIGSFMMVAPDNRRQIASGFSLAMIGMWFFACTRHWYDLTYRNGWPLLVVIFGAEMVLASLLDPGPKKKEKETHHA